MGGEGFEPPAVSRGFRGARRKRRRKRHTGREERAARWARTGGTGPRGRWAGRRACRARPRARGATWGLPGRAARGQRTSALGGHGSSLTRTHALGPTERLAGTIKFVSGGCHRCHRYRNSTVTASARGRIPQEVVHLRGQRAAIPAFPNTIVRGVAAEWAGQSGRPFADGAPVRMNSTM